jgi:predicted kinase
MLGGYDEKTVDALIFIGIPASGKSTFFKERFFRSHVRINLDMLRTRHREQLMFEACLESKADFVVDNTNVTIEERKRYVTPAKAAGFRILGYFFQSQLDSCRQRNEKREASERIPEVGLRGKSKQLQQPSMREGFDELWFVQIGVEGTFEVQEWKNEI